MSPDNGARLRNIMQAYGWRLNLAEDGVWVWTKTAWTSAMCGSYGNPSFPPATATATAQSEDEAERRHIHGLVYDFVGINSRVSKEHRKWKDGEV